MSTSVPPPLPGEAQRGSRVPAFLGGLVLGLALAGAVAFVMIQNERARAAAAEMEAVAAAARVGRQVFNAAGIPINPADLGKAAGLAPAAPPSDADKVQALGDESFEDLSLGRLAAVYNLTTADYRKRVKREEFDKLVTEVPNVKFVNRFQRQSKVRKAADGAGYEYYCSGTGGFNGNVIVTLLFEPGDTGTWRIGKFEIGYSPR